MSILNRKGQTRNPTAPPPPKIQDEPPPPPPPAGRTINFRNRDDLSYLEAIVDMAPVMSSRLDMPDPISKWWKDTIRILLDIAKDAATPCDTDTPQPGHEAPEGDGDGPDAIGMRRVIDAAAEYIHGESDDHSRQANYTKWRETHKEVFGRYPNPFVGF